MVWLWPVVSVAFEVKTGELTNELIQSEMPKQLTGSPATPPKRATIDPSTDRIRTALPRDAPNAGRTASSSDRVCSVPKTCWQDSGTPPTALLPPYRSLAHLQTEAVHPRAKCWGQLLVLPFGWGVLFAGSGHLFRYRPQSLQADRL